MRLKFAFLFTLIGFISINMFSQKKTADTITFPSVLIENHDNGTASYQSTDFVSNAFSKGYKIKSLIKYYKKDFKVTKEPMPNMHDNSKIDTIYHFINKKNQISVYKAIHAEFVNLFEVTDKRFKLYGNIGCGMSKEDFCKKFRIKELKKDTIVITDENNMMKFYFNFKKNSLTKISFKAFID